MLHSVCPAWVGGSAEYCVECHVTPSQAVIGQLLCTVNMYWPVSTRRLGGSDDLWTKFLNETQVVSVYIAYDMFLEMPEAAEFPGLHH